ncbi:MAG: hypothetical protein AB8H79_23350 [Myxococcota bacterium]
MDQDAEWTIDVPEFDIDLDNGSGGNGNDLPPETGGGKGPSGSGGPPVEPFWTSRWAALIPALIMSLFGAQAVAVMIISRSGLGTEAVAWGMAILFIVTFTTLFIAGSRLIGRYRY